jgi:hypothetical protein
MALWEPKSPGQLKDPSLPSTLGLTTKVTVAPDLENSRGFIVRWVGISSAVRYIVYASPSPMNKNKFKEYNKSLKTAYFEVPITVPDDLVFYFWVGYVNPRGGISMIQDEPVYISINSAFESSAISDEIKRDIITDDDMKFYVEEIRRRNLAMLQNDGEDFILYIRRMFGQECVSLAHGSTGTATGERITPMSALDSSKFDTEFDPHEASEFEKASSKDPEYNTSYRCLECFGTGIAGGYYPGIRIRARYGNLPRRIIKLAGQGIEFSNDFNSWAIWHPRIKDRDVLVRIRTGERGIIQKVGQSELRGIPMHQEFDFVSETEKAMIYKINDEAIKKALEAEGGYDVAKWDWSLWS